MKDNREKRVVIDYLPESVQRYRDEFTIVAVDVIRATTTAVTAVATGRRCFPIPSIERALSLARHLDNPLLVGELGGNMPYGFHLTNSPAEIAQRTDIARPMILLSSSGTQLIDEAQRGAEAHLACFRNYAGLAKYLSRYHTRVAVIGAGTRGEFREEDQMCCAWIAEILLQSGFVPVNPQTAEIVKRWHGTPVEACLISKSVEYLRRTNQEKDLEFILTHVNDLKEAFKVDQGEVLMIPSTADRAKVRSAAGGTRPRRRRAVGSRFSVLQAGL